MAEKLLELEIEGMTCTACARRVEKGLNKLPGVLAYVDFATEKAHLTFTDGTQAFDGAKLLPDQREQIKAAVESAGYRVGDGKSELETLRPRLVIGAVLSVAVALISMVPGLQFAGYQWWAFALATPVIAWVAWPFHSAAAKNLRHGDATMDTLVSLGSLVAFSYSVWLVLNGHTHTYFEVAAVVPTVVLFGRFIEVRARRSATDSVRALLSAVPETATVFRDGKRQSVATASLKIGEELFIAAGERIPVDATVISGHGTIDNSTMTGESLPLEVSEGDAVSAGATSLMGELRVRTTASAAGSRISRIADLVREATAQKTQLGRLTDRISGVFVPAVIVLAIATFLIWTFVFNDSTRGFEAAVAVLVIACPCALGIAVPMSLVVATSVGAKRGVVIRNPDTLSLLAKVNTVVFDKTGTLTKGQLEIVSSRGLGGVDAELALAYAAAVERGSKHLIARAIANSDNRFTAEDIVEVAGRGMRGTVNGFRVSAMRPGAFATDTPDPSSPEPALDNQDKDANQPEPANRDEYANQAERANWDEYANQAELNAALAEAGPNTIVIVAWEGWAHGLIELSDELRPQAQAAVQELSSAGITSRLLSGDNPARVAEIAAVLGITEFAGHITPEGKLQELARLKSETSGAIAMIGDGINDVAALAAADVGIAMGSGAHAAQAAAAITILDDDPRSVPFALKLAGRTHRNILQNLGWAFGYNLLLIPVAAAGLLNPMLAGAAMAFSSVSVVANSLRLRRSHA